MESAPHSLARRLLQLSDKDLEVLIARRPEAASIAEGGDPTWARLGHVLGRPGSVLRAVHRLNRFLLQVFELACLEHGHLTPVTAAREGLREDLLAAATAELRRWGLGFAGPDGSLTVPAELASLMHDPGRLGQPVVRLAGNLNVDELRAIAESLGFGGQDLYRRKAELAEAIASALAEPGTASRILAGAPEGARLALAELRTAGGSSDLAHGSASWRQHYGWSSPRWDRNTRVNGPGWLLASGLVMPADPSGYVLCVPAEVERSLRGSVFDVWEPEPPPLVICGLRDDRHPIEVVSAMDVLLGGWRHQPPPALQQGGPPKRELKRLAQTIGWEEEEIAALSGMAFAAGLVEEHELIPEKKTRSRRNPRVIQSRQAEIRVTARGAGWGQLSETERWLELIEVWRETQFGGVGFESDSDLRTAWDALLELLLELPDGQGAPADDLGRALCWRRPLAVGDLERGRAFVRSSGEALRWLGAGGGEQSVGLNHAGRLAFSGARPDEVVRAFPPVVDSCTVTPDHRVVVSGTPSPQLGQLLNQVADTVSVHPARVYRLTEASLGRALDGGQTSVRIVEFLTAHSPRGVPQNVVALIEDVARKHGRVRVGAAGVYVLAEDPALLEELARGRLGRSLPVRRLAPTVAVVDAARPEEVIARLRAAGLMPIADGVVADGGPDPPTGPAVGAKPQPIPLRRRREHKQPEERSMEAAGSLIEALRSSSEKAADIDVPLKSIGLDELIAKAARLRRPLKLLHRTPGGAPERLLMRPITLMRGELHGLCQGGVLRTLALDHVLEAELVYPPPDLGSGPDGDELDGLEDADLYEYEEDQLVIFPVNRR